MIALRGKLERVVATNKTEEMGDSGSQDKPAVPGAIAGDEGTTTASATNEEAGFVWNWKGHWAFGTKLPVDEQTWQPFVYTFEKAVLPSEVLIPSLNVDDEDEDGDNHDNEPPEGARGDAVVANAENSRPPQPEEAAATTTADAIIPSKGTAEAAKKNGNADQPATARQQKVDNDNSKMAEADVASPSASVATPMEVDGLKQSTSIEPVVPTASSAVAESGEVSQEEMTPASKAPAPGETKTDLASKVNSATTTVAAVAESASEFKPTDADTTPKETTATAATVNSAAEATPEAATVTETTTLKEQNDTDSNKPSKITFATPLDPDDPPFTDAADKYPDKCPKGGQWKGYFENVTKTINRRRQSAVISTVQQIPETFHLYLNATPPKGALATFSAEPDMVSSQQETITTDNNNNDSKLIRNINDQNLVPPGRLHVRGTGDNQFGTFEIVGSFDLETQILEIVRMYVNLEPAATTLSRGRSRTPSRARSSSVARSNNNNNNTTDDGRPYFTRKRQMSWKRRSSFGDTGSASDDDGTPTGLKRKSSGTGGGGGKRVRVSDPKGGSVAAGASDTGSVASAPPSAKKLSITIPIGASGKRLGQSPRGSGTPRGKKSGGSTPTSAVSKQQLAAMGMASSTTSSSGSNYMRLPTVEDPKMAVWRAAHFLYYQKTDPALEESANLNFGGHSAAAGAYKYVVYEGDLYKSQREGRGVCVYSNQMLYEGEWKRNKEHGRGTLMSADRKRIIYEGEWERGRMHGRGTYYYSAGVTLNAKDQVVVLDVPSSSKKKGGPDDAAKALFGGNSRYEGDFKENLRHGYGKYVLPDGSTYEGTWREGLMNGRGVFTWKDGSVYDGEWKDGKRHGSGLLRASDGFLYDGMWVQNAMEGRATAVYPNGQQYNGLFSNGRREGRGTLLFTNGAVYEGRFRDDRVDGQGTMKMPNVMTVPRIKKKKTKVKHEGEAAGHKGVEHGQESEGEVDDENPKPDFMIPLSFQSDMSHIHQKAGFTHVGE